MQTIKLRLRGKTLKKTAPTLGDWLMFLNAMGRVKPDHADTEESAHDAVLSVVSAFFNVPKPKLARARIKPQKLADVFGQIRTNMAICLSPTNSKAVAESKLMVSPQLRNSLIALLRFMFYQHGMMPNVCLAKACQITRSLPWSAKTRQMRRITN